MPSKNIRKKKKKKSQKMRFKMKALKFQMKRT